MAASPIQRELVRSLCLEADPDRFADLLSRGDVSVNFSVTKEDLGLTYSCSCLKDKSSHAYLLHFAIIDVHFTLRENDIEKQKKALKIVDLLVGAGAGTDAECRGLQYLPQSAKDVAMTPIELALFLRKYPGKTCRGATNELLMDCVIQKMTHKKSSICQTFNVDEKVWDPWKSSELSDITLLCSDGVSLPARRSILETASPYFATVHSKRWKDAESGSFRMDYPSPVVKVLLSLVDTGALPEDQNCTDVDLVEVLELADKFDFGRALKVAECLLFEALDVSNVKTILQAAHLYHAPTLKRACIEFVRDNAGLVLALATEFQKLSTAHPDLWEEILQAIVPAKANNKSAMEE